jgi:hypothetical protein
MPTSSSSHDKSGEFDGEVISLVSVKLIYEFHKEPISMECDAPIER